MSLFFLCALIITYNIPRSSLRLAFLVTTSLLVLIAAVNIDVVASFLPGERMKRLADGMDASAIERFKAPMVMLVLSFEQSPLWGMGMGQKEALVSITFDAYSRFSQYEFHRLLNAGGHRLWLVHALFMRAW